MHTENAQEGIPAQQGGNAVGILMIKCPATGRDIPTGIETDRRTFADMPVFFSRTYCLFCRTNHEWFAKQAWVREGSPAAERKASDFAVVASGPPKRKDAMRAAKAKFDSATRCPGAK
jgi:hypothetical protein